MTSDPLEAPLKKIKRANKDIQNADVLIHNFMFDNPYAIVIEHDLAAGKKSAKLSLQTDIPDEIDDAVSTAAKKLRESLDNMAFAVASRSGAPKFPKNVNFPIANSQAGFESTGMQGLILQAGGPDWAAFLASLKPYPGGNDALCALHDAANGDKHRDGLIKVGAISAPGFAKFTAAIGSTMSFNAGMFVGPLEDGEILVTVENSQSDPEVQMLLLISLRDVPGFDRLPAITALRQFSGLCEGIVQASRSLF